MNHIFLPYPVVFKAVNYIYYSKLSAIDDATSEPQLAVQPFDK
jgi:hypothetical protein